MRSRNTHYVETMLKRLFGKTPPIAQTIARPARSSSATSASPQAATRWAAVMPPLGRKVRVTRLQREGEHAVTVHFEPVSGSGLKLKAGQYLTHCFEIDGQMLRRPYSSSIAEQTEQGEQAGQWAFTCKRVKGGRVSNFICDHLAVGDEYEVRGPSGEFCLPQGSSPLYLVAAGCGITPIISLLETALQNDPARTIQLIYANRQQSSILFQQRLDDLQTRHSGLQIIHVLSQPEAGWQGQSGRLSGQRLLDLVAPPAAAHAYLCGPQALMDELAAALLDAGLPAENIHQEAFTPAPHATAAHPTQVQKIIFKKSAVEVEQQVGQSILDAALANGVDVAFSCTVGGCAACKLEVLQGQIIMDEPHCLSEDERAQGFALACSAYATETVVINA